MASSAEQSARSAESSVAAGVTVVRVIPGLVPAGPRALLELNAAGASALAQRLAREGAEAIVVTTCSRIEAYAVLRGDRFGFAARRWASLTVLSGLAAVTGVAARHLEAASESQHGFDVVQHLRRVAAGDELLAPGESPLLPRLREAFLDALRHATAGPELNRLFRAVMAAPAPVPALLR